jgi:hypothetical protein
MVTLVYPYYDQPLMLERQIAAWTALASLDVRVVVVDDCSTKFPAVDILKGRFKDAFLDLYRVDENIPWNVSGARNLGCTRYPGWTFVSDLDHLLYPEDAARLFADLESTKNRHPSFSQFPGLRFAFQPALVSLPYNRPLTPVSSTLLFHSVTFHELGGYDEDYAGGYCYEDVDFLMRLRSLTTVVSRPDVTIRLAPHFHIPDATTAELSRSISRNATIYQAKCLALFPKPKPGLRFNWSRLL